MSTKFLSPGWRMPRNANQSRSTNYSLDFDGTNQVFGSSINFLSGATTFSMSAWINLDSLSSSSTYMGVQRTSGNEISIKFDHSSGEFDFTVNSNQATSGVGSVEVVSSSKITANTWHHVVMAYDGSATGNANRLTAFIDGSPQTLAFTGTIPSLISTLMNTRQFCVGGNGGEFNGIKKMSDACLFDYALSASQVTTLWGGGTSVSNPMALPSPPVVYYPLGTSAWNGNFLAENNAIGDYVFNFYSPNVINTGNSLTITKDLTLSGWVNFTATSTSSNTVISKHISSSSTPYFTYQLYIENNGAKFRIGTTTYTIITGTKTNLNDGKWHHILGTYDGSNINLYVDGVSDATAVSASGDLNTAVKDTTIGAVVDGGTGSIASGTVFLGKLSNIKIFNTALSTSEVETLYNYGSPIKTLANIPQSSNLKAWYKLDASEIYSSSSTEWEINQATADYTSSTHSTVTTGSGTQVANIQSWGPTSAITFSAWFKTSESAGSGDPNYFKYLLSAPMDNSVNPSFYIAFYNNSVFTMLKTGGTNNNLSSSVVINDGKWHHIARTYNGSVSNLYIDGQNASTVDDPQTGSLDYGTDSGNNNLGIGCLFNPSRSYPSNTDVSNVSVWSAGLSSSEITELYNNGQPGNLSSHSATSNLTGWWTLKDASAAAGGGLVDLSSNSNNANTANTDVVPGSVSTLNGLSSGMSQLNLVQSDLQTVAPYSKYAMNFDGTDYIDANTTVASNLDFSVSAWINPTSYSTVLLGTRGIASASTSNGITMNINSSGNLWARIFTETSNVFNLQTGGVITLNSWSHVAMTYDSSTKTLKSYLNGAEAGSMVGTDPSVASTANFDIGRSSIGSVYDYFNGKISNVSVWNTALTASQVREIYNEGLPSNLNTFSGTAPIAWWQLGENSSYVGGWTFADEIGSNNGDSGNLPETALTNGVGTTANGTSTGMAVGALVGNAPYSTANAISSGMAVTAKVTNVP